MNRYQNYHKDVNKPFENKSKYLTSVAIFPDLKQF